MKYFRYILLPFLSLLALAGCTRDEVQMEKTGEVRLSLNIPGTIQSKSTTTNPGESTISNVYILFYAQGATDTEKPAFFHSATGLSNTENTWSKVFKTTDMSNLVVNATYDVYALASLPDGVTAPTATTTKAKLLNLQEEISMQAINAWKISFSGTTTYTTGTPEVSIELKRTVARLEISVENNTSSTNMQLLLAKAPASTFYLEKSTTSTLTNCNRKITGTSGTSYRCYLYENPAGSDPVVLQLMGTTKAGLTIFYSIEVKPSNSSEIIRNTSYEVSIRLHEDDITVSTGASPAWDATSSETLTANKIDVVPSANTFIVKPGKTICFPIDRPALANAVISTIPVIAANESLTAELVWTDVKGTSGKGLADDASIADIKVIGSGPDAFLQVKSGSQPGNSVVAVKGQDGTIKWSWQIWVTDYDPETTNGTLEGITYMDRNIGALSNSSGTDYTIGTYYQWGRFQPFPTVKKLLTSAEFVPIYDATGGNVTISKKTVSDIAGLISQPLAFATGYDASNALWAESKTVFDPCPTGWQVASDVFWNKLISRTVTKGTDGFTINSIFFPRTGAIYEGSLMSNNTNVYNWSCGKADNANVHSYLYNFDKGTDQLQTISPTLGFPVRCIKQTN